jgi:hypothetical protein
VSEEERHTQSSLTTRTLLLGRARFIGAAASLELTSLPLPRPTTPPPPPPLPPPPLPRLPSPRLTLALPLLSSSMSSLSRPFFFGEGLVAWLLAFSLAAAALAIVAFFSPAAAAALGATFPPGAAAADTAAAALTGLVF